MKAIELEVTPRQELGSRANKRLRDQGLLPGVIYGHKEAIVPIKMPQKQVAHHLGQGAHVFALKLEGKSENVLVKDVQYDYLGTNVIHVDFTRVSLDERVKVSVPIELKGEPKGQEDGGVLTQVMASIVVECRVLDIPEVIRHNVSEMKLDDVLHVKEIKFPDDVKPMVDGEQIVATVKEVLEEVVAPVAAEAGAAEPEMIGKKPAEEGAEAVEGAAPAKGAVPAKGVAPAKAAAPAAKPEKK
jgi:large subunit ribosomal protein L25